MTLVAALLAGLAAVLAAPARSAGRLRSLVGDPAGPPTARRSLGHADGAPRWAAALAAAGSGVIVGGPVGLAVAALVGVAAYRGLLFAGSRSPPGADAGLLAEAPLAFDLLAACIAAGAAPEAALTGVAQAVDGPLGRRLDLVARAALLGAPAEQAWAPLLGPDVPAPLREAAAGFLRAQRSGAALAPALARLAAEQRQARRTATQAAARRAGVLAVAPLGACFLPAFVLVGVVPLVAGLITEVGG